MRTATRPARRPALLARPHPARRASPTAVADAAGGGRPGARRGLRAADADRAARRAARRSTTSTGTGLADCASTRPGHQPQRVRVPGPAVRHAPGRHHRARPRRPSPTPRPLAAGRATSCEQHHVTTIYYETLVSPAVARTVAGETGAPAAVLDPLEGLTDAIGRRATTSRSCAPTSRSWRRAGLP